MGHGSFLLVPWYLEYNISQFLCGVLRGTLSLLNKGEQQYCDFSVAVVSVRLSQHWYVPDLVATLVQM